MNNSKTKTLYSETINAPLYVLEPKKIEGANVLFIVTVLPDRKILKYIDGMGHFNKAIVNQLSKIVLMSLGNFTFPNMLSKIDPDKSKKYDFSVLVLHFIKEYSKTTKSCLLIVNNDLKEDKFVNLNYSKIFRDSNVIEKRSMMISFKNGVVNLAGGNKVELGDEEIKDIKNKMKY